MRFDTPIEVTEETGSTESEARRCGTKLSQTGSTIAKTLSTTETIDCEEILKEAQTIRRNRQGDGATNVVSGNFYHELNFTVHCEAHSFSLKLY